MKHTPTPPRARGFATADLRNVQRKGECPGVDGGGPGALSSPRAGISCARVLAEP